MTRLGILRILQQHRNEDVGIEDIDAHRGRNLCRIVGRAQISLLRLFLEADDPAVAIDLDHSKMTALCRVHQDGRHRHIGARLVMLLQHEPVIHLVDVIAGKNHHVLGLLRADGINILLNRIGRPHIPVFAYPLHRGQYLDELTDLTPENIPTLADVAVQRERLVLRQDVNAVQAGVQAVRKGDVNDAVDAAEGDGRLGAVAGQRIKTLTRASGEQDSERVFHSCTVLEVPL